MITRAVTKHYSAVKKVLIIIVVEHYRLLQFVIIFKYNLRYKKLIDIFPDYNP